VTPDRGIVETKAGYQCLPGHNELQIAEYSELFEKGLVSSVTYFFARGRFTRELGATRDLLFQLAIHDFDVEWLLWQDSSWP
jgi:hypothetical protein